MREKTRHELVINALNRKSEYTRIQNKLFTITAIDEIRPAD